MGGLWLEALSCPRGLGPSCKNKGDLRRCELAAFLNLTVDQAHFRLDQLMVIVSMFVGLPQPDSKRYNNFARCNFRSLSASFRFGPFCMGAFIGVFPVR
jgi:hypothetical protein